MAQERETSCRMGAGEGVRRPWGEARGQGQGFLSFIPILPPSLLTQGREYGSAIRWHFTSSPLLFPQTACKVIRGSQNDIAFESRHT